MSGPTRIERRKERKPIDFQERRVEELLRAAESLERRGQTATALLMRNEVWKIQNPGRERL